MQQVALSRAQTVGADFDALIGPHLEAGYRTALAILGNPDEAHDAVQESAFKAWRKLHQLRESSPARSWFLAIVANQCRSERRRHWWSVIRMPQIDTGEARSEETAQTMDIDSALVATAPWLGGSSIHLALIDFRSGQVVCRFDGPEGLGGFVAEPAGPGFAITLRVVPNRLPDDPLSDVLVFHPYGTTTQIPGRYATTW